MPWFAERFVGYLLRIGPEARAYGDPYLWAIPIRDDGEIVGVSTTPLTPEAARTAIKAAQSLGFDNPNWLHRNRRMNTMALPTDVQTLVDAVIQTARNQVADAVDALNTGATRMLAAAAALQGAPNEHPVLDEVMNTLNQAEQEISSQLGAAVASFRSASSTLANVLPIAPATA